MRKNCAPGGLSAADRTKTETLFDLDTVPLCWGPLSFSYSVCLLLLLVRLFHPFVIC